MRKRWRVFRGWLIALAVIGGAFAGVYFLLNRPHPVDVRVTRVKRGRVENTVANTKAGSVRSRRVAEISVESPGKVVEIPARKGAVAKKGKTLIALSKSDAESALESARKELVVAEHQVAEAKLRKEHAEREWERWKGLPNNVPAEAQRDQAQMEAKVTDAAHSAAEARFEAQKGAVARAELALDKCEILAPFDGVVADLYIEVGEWAVPGKPVLKLLDTQDLYIRAELDEVDIGRIEEKQSVRVTFDPWKDRKFEGHIVRLAPFISEVKEQNRTVEIEVELTPGVNGVHLKHGMSADVEVVLDQKDNVLRVPTLAIMEGNRVLVVGSEGRAVAVPIKVGLKNWEYAQVVDGLKESDPVIVSLESEKVKEGVEVRVVQESER